MVLHALKVAYESTPESEALTDRNEAIRDTLGQVLLVLGQLPIFLSMAYIMYGPIGKPGITALGSLDIKTAARLERVSWFLAINFATRFYL